MGDSAVSGKEFMVSKYRGGVMRSPAKTLYVLLLSLILFAGCLNAPGAADDDDDDDDDSDDRIVPYFGVVSTPDFSSGPDDNQYNRLTILELNSTPDEYLRLMRSDVCSHFEPLENYPVTSECVVNQLWLNSSCENGVYTTLVTSSENAAIFPGAGMACTHQLTMSYTSLRYYEPFEHTQDGHFSILIEHHELD